MKFFTPLLFIILSISAHCQVPESTTSDLVLGKTETFHSTYLDEERELNIYLPEHYYDYEDQEYDVVYVLDGSRHEDFPHIAGIVQFLNMYGIVSPTIVVGIENVDRYRDFTFVSTDSLDYQDIPQAGGSEVFINFLENEVQPLVESKYQTGENKTIIGQSLGGLLATEILLKKPDLFDDYIIVSPSLWWDKQSLANEADSILKSKPDLEKRIFLSMGTEHPVMHEVADKLADAIKESENDKLFFRYEVLSKEDHATILHRAVYRGLEVLNGRE